MPSKKEKHHQVLAGVKAQTTPLANSTNTTPPSTNQNLPLENSSQTVTTNHFSTITTKKPTLKNDTSSSLDRLSSIRDQKHELDELNHRFSNYVDALQKKTKENNDLQKKVDTEKQKHKTLSNRDHNDLESKMDELRNDIDESTVLTDHFTLKRNRALKELSLLKDKIRSEENQSYNNRRQALENEYQQSSNQLKELTRRYEDVEKFVRTNQTEMNQMNDLYEKLENELHDLILNNIRLECNLRTIQEKTVLTKTIYDTEKAELTNEQIQQQQFYTNELDKAIDDIKRDFQTLLKTNKVVLENTYTERIEQAKTQLLTYEANKQQEQPTTSRISVETLQEELKQTDKARDDIENEYRSLIDLYSTKQKEKYQIDEERIRLDHEYNRLIHEINHMIEEIELGRQSEFSIRFELETYRRLLDLETIKATMRTSHTSLVNGKEENGIDQVQVQQIIPVKKTDIQRAISKTGEMKRTTKTIPFEEGSILTCNIILGKFDIDQVQAGFISINNAATNCVDQSLKDWTLVRTLNDEQESTFQFPDTTVLKARTRIRVYSNKADNMGSSSSIQGRLIASSVPAWASTGQGENVKITLLDDKGINRAQYSETWQ